MLPSRIGLAGNHLKLRRTGRYWQTEAFVRRTIIVYVSSFMQSAKNYRGFTRCQTPHLSVGEAKSRQSPFP